MANSKQGEKPNGESVFKDPLRTAVSSACSRLQGAYLGDKQSPAHHSSRARLAELRRGAGLKLEQNPLALELTIYSTFPEFEENLVGKGDRISDSERAAYFALSLFGVHMQSATMPMHVPVRTFANACGVLSSRRESSSVKHRVDAMLLASSEDARMIHVRSLVTLLRAEEIGFDYGKFAQDLRGLMNPKKRPSIQLTWGRDFALGFYRSQSPQQEP
ncbi:type I-E CRISPR-associated protein Cse2/CasB [Corynebacterium uterequi]|uniref:CRISPR type I-E/ECOLI-associated protein CasB/Cse2 n=1 Tax=Corynebacterium uterequi TaxID=1072256 RepID=A0A0G3HKU7_9CORY|nr:type I-E CRISPR-associated protein Cse2/CasB [Corynebacterium uterequi]AKK11722.1 CRISPR type I-E/ECOLI-associated protein CasB/Cse2 [Corynebacterium uterequi]